MSEWELKTLDDVVELRRGFDLPHHSRRPGHYPVLTSGATAGWHDEGPVKGPGLAIGRATNLGEPTWSDVDFWPLNTTLYAADFRGNAPKWVYHLFESLDLTGYDSGSVQPMLNRNYIAKVKVGVPPLLEQQAIAEVLGAIDNKVAANSTMVEGADELSQTLFRSIGRESVPIPLSTSARFVNGRAFTKGASGTGRVVIRIAELNSGVGGSTVYSDAEVGEDFLARPGDILFAWSGSLTLHRWFRREGIVNQHIFKVIPKGYPSWLIYELLRERLPHFKGIAADKATTMGHIQKRHLDESVDVPSRSAIGRMDALMTSLWERTLLAERENESLATARDALLPQLMSGKLRVRDAEKVLEGVL
ncbi:restriction endonuclease subunit S [Cryobacterium sp. TMT2-23]|uniref:restriction endonuclease subunit S n=1 Tax=Cryobacterium sp. TMT2-23 TaxID=1259252 RepID=UPI00141ACE63|nr:restriction endonuclease subunit S [Cryobacterium sp. TMT2-23]